jgi:hypothetical protein
MRGLFIILGESFRSGGQDSRVRGTPESVPAQMLACDSHIRMIEHLKKTYSADVSVFLGTYTTPYDRELLHMYHKYLVDHKILGDVIGLNNLFRLAVQSVTISKFDFLFYVRIDLFLKEGLFAAFRPDLQTIHFPFVCWIRWNKFGNDPRVGDTFLFLPKKYYPYLPFINIYHGTWCELVNKTNLTYHDLDTFITTYHDSDTEKDSNPLYFIVNRPEATTWWSEGHQFDKWKFFANRFSTASDTFLLEP